MTSWLNKHKKQELVELADEAGLQLDDGLRKDELVEQLADHLQQNATRLSRNNAFEGYYGQRSRTPFKARESSATRINSDDAEVKSVVRGRGRRATKVKPEPEPEEDFISPTRDLPTTSSPTRLSQRTPAANIIQRRRSSLPPSPALVAQQIERAEARAYAGLEDLYSVSGIPETIDWAREACSSLAAVHLTFLFLEAYSLNKHLMGWFHLFDSPVAFGFESHEVWVPNLFDLLTADFWKPTLLWASTSIFIPLVFGYFFNLTVHSVKRHGARVKVVRYDYDPVTFNIVKMLLTSAVYGNGLFDRFLGPEVAYEVSKSQYGGYNGILMSTFVGVIFSIWEGTQR